MLLRRTSDALFILKPYVLVDIGLSASPASTRILWWSACKSYKGIAVGMMFAIVCLNNILLPAWNTLELPKRVKVNLDLEMLLFWTAQKGVVSFAGHVQHASFLPEALHLHMYRVRALRAPYCRLCSSDMCERDRGDVAAVRRSTKERIKCQFYSVSWFVDLIYQNQTCLYCFILVYI